MCRRHHFQTPDNVTYVYFDTATNESPLLTDAFHCLHGALYAVELAGLLSRYIEEHPETTYCLISLAYSISKTVVFQLILLHFFCRFIYIGEAENLINGVWSEWSQQYWTVSKTSLSKCWFFLISHHLRENGVVVCLLQCKTYSSTHCKSIRALNDPFPSSSMKACCKKSHPIKQFYSSSWSSSSATSQDT